MDTDACGGHLRLVFLLRTLFAPTPRRTLCLRPRPRRLPRRYRMDRVAHRSARHVRACGCADQPAVYRVRLPPPRARSRVDAAWDMAGSGLYNAPSPGSLHAQPGRPGGRVAGTGDGARNGASRYCARSPPRKAYNMKVYMGRHCISVVSRIPACKFNLPGQFSSNLGLSLG